jgi:uncharacterized protein (PEP-CTERM system associated)
MQSWVGRASRAGRFAGGCVFLLAMASTGASAQSVFNSTQSVFNGVGRPIGEDPSPLIDTRDFSISPLVGLQETFTDNALLTEADKKVDFITRPMVGAQVDVHGPFTANFIGHAYYDAYANQTQLSGLSGDAIGTANYVVIPDFLKLEAAGLLMNGNVSTFGAPAISRVGPANQIQIATYDIGPHLTTTLDSFADLDVAGRFAQLFYDNPNGSTATIPPSSTILAGAMAIDTAQRYLGYQLTTNAQIEQDDHNFQAYNFQQSVFVGIFPSFRLIGRGGYDSVEQPSIVNIREAMWSAGGEYTFGVNPGTRDSALSIEYGSRFGHAAWRGDLYLQISDRFYAQGRYFESIQPDQLQINSAFTSFAEASVQLPTELSSSQFQVNGNIDNQTALNKEADITLVYTWPDQSLGLRGTWNDRMLLALNNAHDRSLVTGVDYLRSIAPDLGFTATVEYYRTFDNPFFGASENYGGNVGLQYDLNSTMRAVVGYAYQHQVEFSTSGESITENVVFGAITKRF